MQWFDVASTAELFGTTQDAVRKWIKMGKLKAHERPCATRHPSSTHPSGYQTRIVHKTWIPRTELENFLVGRVSGSKNQVSLKELLEDGQRQGEIVVVVSEDSQSSQARTYGEPQTRAALWQEFYRRAQERVQLQDVTDDVKHPVQLGLSFSDVATSPEGDHYYIKDASAPVLPRPVPNIKPRPSQVRPVPVHKKGGRTGYGLGGKYYKPKLKQTQAPKHDHIATTAVLETRGESA